MPVNQLAMLPLAGIGFEIWMCRMGLDSPGHRILGWHLIALAKERS